MDFPFPDVLEQIFAPVFDPRKRLYFGYLLCAVPVVIVYAHFSSRDNPWRALKCLADIRIWWSRSARCDYLIVFINHFVMRLLGPRLVSTLAVTTFLFESLHHLFDGRPMALAAAPDWSIALAFTAVLFVFDDATKYLVHRWLHTVPFLWAFHKVHHSAQALTPITVFRVHPVEGVLFSLRATAVQAGVLSVFFFFFGERVDLISVLGANVFLFAFNVTGSNLRHTHVWISYGRILERLLISPAQHQIHHSTARRHVNKNYGAVLAVWDGLGGSLYGAGDETNLRFGLSGERDAPNSLQSVYLRPFAEALAVLKRAVWKRKAPLPRGVGAAPDRPGHSR